MSGLHDSFNRPIDYLRVSVTDRCNMRCVYCMPEEGVQLVPRSDLLSYEEIRSIVEVAAGMGITKVRLSGGEPLLRAGFLDLVEMLADIPGINDLAVSTNGCLLAKYATRLKKAGARRVNVSLDTLRKDRFIAITRRDGLDDVLQGMEAARRTGLNPVKINTVVIRGMNDDEILEFAMKSVTDGWHVRFIELMPLTRGDLGADRFVSIAEVKRRLETLGALEPATSLKGNGPAKYFTLPGAKGTIGFISPVSEHFCFGCNRLRLTADGKLRPCLLSDTEIDLRAALRESDRSQLEELFRHAVSVKPRQHLLAEGSVPEERRMSQIGG